MDVVQLLINDSCGFAYNSSDLNAAATTSSGAFAPKIQAYLYKSNLENSSNGDEGAFKPYFLCDCFLDSM
jgi:hypothetical protein